MKAILFDLDGTLVDSLSATFDAFNHVIEKFNRPRMAPAEIMKYFGVGEGGIFAGILGPEQADEAYAQVKEYMDENVHRMPLHAGVLELLEQVRAAGIPTSIVTGRSWGTTKIILEHHGILDRFVTVVADDHVSSPKPSPEGLLLALGRMKVEARDSFYVGDSPADIRAARAAGAQGVAALWDLLARRESLEPQQPHHWATQPADVWAIWETVLAKRR